MMIALVLTYISIGLIHLGANTYFNWWHVKRIYRESIGRLFIVGLIGIVVNIMLWPLFVWRVIRGR